MCLAKGAKEGEAITQRNSFRDSSLATRAWLRSDFLRHLRVLRETFFAPQLSAVREKSFHIIIAEDRNRATMLALVEVFHPKE